MPLRLVQNGATSVRPLIVIYHAASEVDERVRTACGSYPAIINYTAKPMAKSYYRVGENGFQSLPVLYEWARKKTGAIQFAPVVLAGFSEGCQGIRAQLLATQFPDGICAVDGVHCSKPVPEEGTPKFKAELAPWVNWLNANDFGEHGGAVFTHSMIEPGTYSAVHTALEAIFQRSKPFGPGPDDNTPAVFAPHRGCEVWGFPGTDAKAHGRQLMMQLPRALNRVLYMLGELKENGPELQALEALLAKGGGISPSKPGQPGPSKPGFDPGKGAEGTGGRVARGVAVGVGLAAMAGGLWYMKKRGMLPRSP